ncbi:MAG: cyclopropane-fatty-acyl-phospholipid synthase, partial [Nanoarchaeota archaeon]|nr:cyclopropane-fatty-acyl-phospholipid synthase [Nanoarchaeota archaeon]
MATNPKQTIETLLAQADVQIDGNRAWDIQVHNPKLYSRVLAGGSLALGESYMEGWWDCKALDEFFNRILSVEVDKKIIRQRHLMFNLFKAKITNLQKKAKAYEIGKKHYDLGNDLYKNM